MRKTALFALLLAGCRSGHGDRSKEIMRVTSADHLMDVLLVPNMDSGAFGDESMSVMLVAAGDDPRGGQSLLTGTRFSGRKGLTYIDMRWVDAEHLELTLGSGIIMAFQNSAFTSTKAGVHYIGVRLNAPFFGPT